DGRRRFAASGRTPARSSSRISSQARGHPRRTGSRAEGASCYGTQGEGERQGEGITRYVPVPRPCGAAASRRSAALPARRVEPLKIFIEGSNPTLQTESQKGGKRRPPFEILAEREGFEPSMGLLAPYSLSRGAPSTSSAISPSRKAARIPPVARHVKERVEGDPTQPLPPCSAARGSCTTPASFSFLMRS